jgi:hypothetical protein
MNKTFSTLVPDASTCYHDSAVSARARLAELQEVVIMIQGVSCVPSAAFLRWY